MKLLVLFFTLLATISVYSQVVYDTYFNSETMRYDFLFGGNINEEKVFFQEIKKEGKWAGSRKNLVDVMNYGNFRYRIFDEKSDSLLFSRGFSTLFDEWQTTAEAKETDRTFYQSVRFPFPKQNVRLEIDARQWDGNFRNLYKTVINPKNYFVINEKPLAFKTEKILDNGAPEEKVDIVILAEGYSANDLEKFIADAKRITGYLFEAEPFKSEKSKFNVSAVCSVSEESGTDIPGEHIYKNTVFNSTFYTFDVSRYLTTSDTKNILDAAASVPHDQVYVLVNSKRYGGGGFYNTVSVCTADNQLTPQVFIHEFGHGFAGLADEYYNSEVAYEDFYNLKVEPWEPNITTLVNFDSKWKGMIDPATEIPTQRIDKNDKITGVYEGGGYMNKGIYSPFMDCRMKSNNPGDFCPVCSEAIKKMIRFYTE